jgi:hypothetical protein
MRCKYMYMIMGRNPAAKFKDKRRVLVVLPTGEGGSHYQNALFFPHFSLSLLSKRI